MELMSLLKENKEQMSIANPQKVMNVPIEAIMPNPDTSRRIFDDSELWQLSYSIRTYGVMQPIIVRRLGIGVYELIAGERRLRASKLAGKRTIPAILFQASHDAAVVMNMVENTQRSNLSFAEEAKSYDHYIKRYGFSVAELAKKLGKNPYEIDNKLRILKLPPEVIDKLSGHNLTEFHANSLLRLSDKNLQKEVVDIIISRGFDVAQTDAYVDKLISGKIFGKNGKKGIKDYKIVPKTMEQLSVALTEAGISAVLKSRDLKNSIQYTITVAKPGQDCKQMTI